MACASHRRRSPAVLAVTSAAVFANAGCGSPPDRTDVDAPAIPTARPFEPVPEAACGRGVYTQGDGEVEPQDDSYRAGLVLPGASDGFDVLYTLTQQEMTNDCMMLFSRASVDGGPGGAQPRCRGGPRCRRPVDRYPSETSFANTTKLFGYRRSGSSPCWHVISRSSGPATG